jgi:peptide/nickel transport system permease protein
MQTAPWLALWPGLFLTIVVYCLNMFGDAVRDLLDPRLRGGIGSMGTYGTKGAKKARKKLGLDKAPAKGEPSRAK